MRENQTDFISSGWEIRETGKRCGGTRFTSISRFTVDFYVFLHNGYAIFLNVSNILHKNFSNARTIFGKEKTDLAS